MRINQTYLVASLLCIGTMVGTWYCFSHHQITNHEALFEVVLTLILWAMFSLGVLRKDIK